MHLFRARPGNRKEVLDRTRPYLLPCLALSSTPWSTTTRSRSSSSCDLPARDGEFWREERRRPGDNARTNSPAIAIGIQGKKTTQSKRARACIPKNTPMNCRVSVRISATIARLLSAAKPEISTTHIVADATTVRYLLILTNPRHCGWRFVYLKRFHHSPPSSVLAVTLVAPSCSR